ncbi:MAG: ATP phosphoribosyltransferase regulatory subunit [Clostridia bacterium]|nr:ATP phosphoribosyltransferase regulatory subunit [Clostridia bacterium]
MNKWKLYNPEGMQDILNENCYMKRNAEEILRKMYLANGFMEIETPLVEFYDVFSAAGSGTAMQSTYKMIDEKGRILTVRPDMTIPAARVAATKLRDDRFPAKLFYTGKCMRSDDFGGGRQKEFTQSGVEIIGSKSLFYDALVIATAVGALQAIGMEEFIIELGQVDFFKGLMELTGLGDDDSEKIRKMIDSKDFFGVEEMLFGRQMDDGVKNLLLNLPSYYGKREMLQDVREKASSSRLLGSIDELLGLLDILDDFGVSDYISVDLGMVKRLDYYTGIIFRGMTYGMGFPILGGGRYDTLCEKFGKPMAATGFSFGLDMALTAIYRNKGETTGGISCDSIICFGEDGRRDALKAAAALKLQQLRVELIPIENGLEAVRVYADAKGIKGLLHAAGNGIIEAMDLEKGTVSTADLGDMGDVEL